MAVYCRSCAERNGYPRPSVRTARDIKCQFCGQIDYITRNKPDGSVVKQPIGNYSYPDHLLPGNPAGRDAQAEREREGR